MRVLKTLSLRSLAFLHGDGKEGGRVMMGKGAGITGERAGAALLGLAGILL